MSQLHVDREAENVKPWVSEEYTTTPRETEPINISSRGAFRKDSGPLLSYRACVRVKRLLPHFLSSKGNRANSTLPYHRKT